MEKEKYLNNVSEEEQDLKVENQQEKIDKEKIKSRLKSGWGKIRNKITQPILKNAKKAVVLSSIALAMISASEGMALTHQELADVFKKETKKYELILGEDDLQKLESEQYGSLFEYAENNQQEINPEKITAEFSFFNSVSKILNKHYEDKTGKSGNFDLAGRAYSKIEEANQYFEWIEGSSDEEKKEFRIKILEKGRLNWEELVKSFPLIYSIWKTKILVHEIGHQEEASRQGAKTGSIKVGLGLGLTGYSPYRGELNNPELNSAAGIKNTESMSDFIIDGLKSRDQNNQIMAMLALCGRMDAPAYAIYTALGEADSAGNDIKEFSKETGVSEGELYAGLLGNFIINSDNWKLIKMALGDESVKLSDNFWQYYYKLAKGGPETGIKVGFKF